MDVWIAVYDVSIRRSKHSFLLCRPASNPGTGLITLLTEKLLQAVAALNRAAALSSDHPELHVRLVDVKQRGTSLSLYAKESHPNTLLL